MTSSAGDHGTTSVLLASGSPQRSALLRQLGYDFRVQVPDVTEVSDGEATELARHNALIKARYCASERRSDELIVAVDTVVAVDGVVYGKPTGVEDARRMLLSLRGRSHTVVGGLVVLREDALEHVLHDATTVHFRGFSDQMLDDYMASGEWQERAGGYAIQGSGAALVAGVEGDFWNVVGLPVNRLLNLMDEQRITLRRHVHH